MTEPTPKPDGAHWDGHGVRFQLAAPHAEVVELCLFESPASPIEQRKIPLAKMPCGRWEVYVTDALPGQTYGYRVWGPWDPSLGLRFSPAKLLLDPLATAICGPLIWNPALFDNYSDSAPFVPRSVVIDRSYDWGADRSPRIPWEDTVVYECHVRGMTQLHPAVPEPMRGTYLGLAHEAVIEYLLGLGVSTVELLPVQHFVSEERLQRLGLSNYFGYNPIGWMAPHADYASGDQGAQVREFKSMVAGLHAAGLEVILDVVFNHTAEGNHEGPTISLRGIDNASYYRLVENHLTYYENFSGCGNSLHFGHELTLDLTLACLRYWVSEMHVDGFRFDLATVLGRGENTFDPDAPLFARIASDPVLSQAKMIAEPWDVGPAGYQLGSFPSPWREWNDRYRDTVRGFWRGDRGLLGELTRRLSGSPDLFPAAQRGVTASVNLLTCHDGFTLQDLVTYEHTHNWDNGEHNQDGHRHNLSHNWGVEGPTDKPEVNHLRRQMQKNFIATLGFSKGIPMLSHGDELGRTQRGNNNAYCHDSELTWIPWSLATEDNDLLAFCRRVFRLRRDLDLNRVAQEGWISSHGEAITRVDWGRRRYQPVGCHRIHDDLQTLIIVNGDDHGHLFELPEIEPGHFWLIALNTAAEGQRRLRGRAVRVPPQSLLLLVTEP